jgi:hypothetical protein
MSSAIPFVPSASFTTTIIQPHPNTHGTIVKLSAIDQIAPRDYISSYLFFPVSQNADTRQIFHLFGRALVNTISDIPELACSVRRRIGNDREEVELLFDSSQGARLNYRDYTAPELQTLWKFGTFHQLERDCFPLNIPRHIVFGTSAKLVQGASIPALVLQCNFISGGLILGTCLHVSPHYLRCILLLLVAQPPEMPVVQQKHYGTIICQDRY